MIDQVKIGSFLKILRKEKEKTQEEIAEIFGVSSRSVSRWENGKTMPDLSILVELSDYYDVDIREIIYGERKNEEMVQDTKETLLKIADYANAQKKQAIIRAIILFVLEFMSVVLALGLIVKQSEGQISAVFVVIPMIITIAFLVMLIMNAKAYIRDFQNCQRRNLAENSDL